MLIENDEKETDNLNENQQDAGEQDENTTDNSEQQGDLEVSIEGEDNNNEEAEDEEQLKSAPNWVKELRKTAREQKRENRELKAKLEAIESGNKEQQQQQQQSTLGVKPTLESCDYDELKYEKQLDSWYEQKRKQDEIVENQKKQEDAQRQEWLATVDDYNKKKVALKVKDYDDAEETVKEKMSVTQQGMILQGAENPALLIYAIGKNKKIADELSSIKDPVKFAFAVARMETKLKVTNRKVSTQPEKVVSGSGKVSGSVDTTLDKLREEARKTGDMTKVMEYKRKLKSKE